MDFRRQCLQIEHSTEPKNHIFAFELAELRECVEIQSPMAWNASFAVVVKGSNRYFFKEYKLIML